MQTISVAYYKIFRVNATIKQTPAIAAGLTDKPWTILEMLEKAAEE